MLRSHTCGELRLSDKGKKVQLSGWVQKIRDKGKLVWIDIRDRYGITQLIFEEENTSKDVFNTAKKCGREFVIFVEGNVSERSSKNDKLNTGDIEVLVDKIIVLNESEVPPFTIEEDSDGGDDLRMKYRYLDIRRSNVKDKLLLRHKLLKTTRDFFNDADFIEVETPVLIKSTPEGARDFIVPSRMNQGQFYALPQSPQTFKQLLMVGGLDKYYQLVKCFRDEDLRSDRQPEFTQIDCEMSFVDRSDVIQIFGNFMSHLFKKILNIDIGEIPIMKYDDAMKMYGSDKPDLRFDMKICDISSVTQGKGFKVFDDAESVLAISVPGCSNYSRKDIDVITEYVKTPQIGSKGLVYLKVNEDGTFKSSVDKFYSSDDLKSISKLCKANQGDLILILAGEENQNLKAMSELRLLMGKKTNLFDNKIFKPVWIVDFPLFIWDSESDRYHSVHHPFTSPLTDDIESIKNDTRNIKANAYDLVINGVEIGGGSIRIHDRKLQETIFEVLGFSKEEAKNQFGFLLDAFRFGTPPHGGIAFGFDRICSLFAGEDSIKDFIAFPKNTSGRDVMIDSPSIIDNDQLDELGIKLSD